MRTLAIRFAAFLALTAAASATFAGIQTRALSTSQTSGSGLQDGAYQSIDTTAKPVVFSRASTSVESGRPVGVAAHANSWIEARPGQFKASLHADALSGVGNGYVQAYSYVHGEWQDTITIKSDTLAAGTNVQLTATVDLDYAGSISPGSFWYIDMYTNGVNYYTDEGYTAQKRQFGSLTVQLHGQVGRTIDIWQNINSRVDTPTVINGQAGNVDLDIAHTVNLYITSTSDVTVEGLAGNTYTPQVEEVPEPASLCLWGFGCAGFGLVSWARRRR
jgi:hypothetical protein